ncbi:MAG: homoserine dehydrogenase [Candidatus Omnitrophica bacterium]|nr:homoserine dehydrogenase [Candidatus Omnitrophota bacterium]
MNKINVGLIGYGTVGSGVVQLLEKRKAYIQNRFNTEFIIKTVCDLAIHQKDTQHIKDAKLTTNYEDIVNDPEINVVIELIGGLNPAKDIVVRALKAKKHIVTANKALISDSGKELFELAKKENCHLFFESSVGAGIPIIKSMTEGLVGNKFKGVYGIINGTCNYILTEMTKKGFTFAQALKEAQKKGYAESDPTLDINGMDSAHKLAILIYLAFGKKIKATDMYVEGITQIAQSDIEYVSHLNYTVKLLAIAKKEDDEIEARVHPTLISNDNPLASINDVYNAVFLDCDPLGSILLSGEGAGQMAAASGVVSDLINLSGKEPNANLFCNLYDENVKLKIRKIDQVKNKFYIRFMAIDKPGVLAAIAGILGKHGISINSVNQKVHDKTSAVPVVMLTDFATNKMLQDALERIQKLPIVKSQPVAIRIMEQLW